MEPLTITLVQANLVWEDPPANRSRLAKLLEQRLIVPTQLIILPEMFTTGFTMNPVPWAETMQEETLVWMQNLAQAYQAVVTGSIICKTEEGYYNRLLWVSPTEPVLWYDKRHLFSYAGEDEYYQAGQEQLLVNYRGWRIMPLICYDLRFPVWSRNVQAYDLLFYVANFPDKRGEAWRTLLRARAIENQSFTIGLNRVGFDGNGIYYAGDSCLVDYAGKVVQHLPPREIVQTFTLEPASQIAFRERFAFLPDQDKFLLE